jgi:hypothetical protein
VRTEQPEPRECSDSLDMQNRLLLDERSKRRGEGSAARRMRSGGCLRLERLSMQV